MCDIGEGMCLNRAQRILKDNTHPSHSLAKDTEVSAALTPDPVQLYSPAHEIPELILNTPLSKIDIAGLIL